MGAALIVRCRLDGNLGERERGEGGGVGCPEEWNTPPILTPDGQNPSLMKEEDPRNPKNTFTPHYDRLPGPTRNSL